MTRVTIQLMLLNLTFPPHFSSMSCIECDSPFCSMQWCSGCTHASCKAMTMNCDECNNIQCMECIEECEMCAAQLCTTCTVQDVTSCKCCGQMMSVHSMPILCVSCVMSHWFTTDHTKGYRCNACVDHCSENGCNVTNILAAQIECPICLEPFVENYSLQHCDVHKVCLSCDYDKNRGCPLCRVGKCMLPSSG